MIKNYTDFLNENLRYGSSFGEDFVEKATAILKKEGFEVNVISSPTQLKNRTLSCKLKFPAIFDFMETYFKVGRNCVALYRQNTLENLEKSLEMEMIIYKRGAALRSNITGSNHDFLFNSYEELANNMKFLFTKSFIKGSYRDFSRSSDGGAPWIVISPRLRMKLDHVDNIKPKSCVLPSGVFEVLDRYIEDFSLKYKILEKASPAYVKNLSLALCACAEFIAFNYSTEKFFVTDDLSSIRNRSNESFFYISFMETKVIKQNVSTVVDYYIQFTDRRYGTRTEELRSLYEKFEKMTDAKREEYFTNFISKKQGAITGKKYGL